MNREQLHKVISESVGNPNSGPVADAINAITDAVDEALNPKPKIEKRVIEPTETR
jgi:nucleoid DNA-binding protein